MSIRLNGSTSGYAEIDSPAVGGNNTLILPGGNGNADQVLGGNGSGTLSWVDRGRMVLATAQNTTSGTAIDFTGIPSWVKRIAVMFNGVSTNGTSSCQVQLGTSSGFVITGYTSSSFHYNSNSAAASTTGLVIDQGGSAAAVRHGLVSVVLHSSNTWVESGTLLSSTNQNVTPSAGIIALGGTLDRLRLTTVNGTDTFDAGSVNILYEG